MTAPANNSERDPQEVVDFLEELRLDFETRFSSINKSLPSSLPIKPFDMVTLQRALQYSGKFNAYAEIKMYVEQLRREGASSFDYVLRHTLCYLAGMAQHKKEKSGTAAASAEDAFRFEAGTIIYRITKELM